MDERRAVPEVTRRVAEELGLPEGQAPTTTQFDEVSKRLGLGVSASPAGRAWVKWRFACEAFISHRVRRSARQRALMKANTGKRRAHEDLPDRHPTLARHEPTG